MLVPIACRFVPYDQWFLTHLDDACKVKQIKLWLLSKCSLVQSGRQTQRPASPITFAPSIRARPSLDSLDDDGYHEDDEYSDQDLPPRRSTPSRRQVRCDVDPFDQPASSQYTLLSFSTGSILEDEFTLSWYNLRPYELLEMHPVGIIIPLQRGVLAEYMQPYFQAKVRVLRAVWSRKAGRFEALGGDAEREPRGYKAKDKLAHRLDAFSPKRSMLQSEKGRKTRLDWKTRWVVINHGVFSLCKDHATSPPLHNFGLSTMRALRGADALERAFSIITQPRVVCIKFRPRSTSLAGVVSPPPSSPSSPILETSNVQECLDSALRLKWTMEQERSDGEYVEDANEAWKGEGEWIVLDMLDDHAFSSILRVLHRQASLPISSSFVTSPSVVTASHHLWPPVVSPLARYDTIPYPEWRIHTVENARKAGMGDVGKSMAWILWTERGQRETPLGNVRHHHKVFSRTMHYKADTVPSDICGSADEDEDDDDSEVEWEGWMRDLERQRHVKEQLDKAGGFAVARQAHYTSSMSSTSPLPSPPLSETSPSGSPRVKSPALSSPRSYSHVQYPNIGHAIQASESQSYLSSERTKSTTISSVSVGTALPSPRRSSGLSMGLATTSKQEHEKAKHSAGAVRAPADIQRSPRTPVRQVHSSSSLKMPSPRYESDAGGSVVQGSTSPSKRQSAFMRGMSLRAGRIVRGLESAIDFVDEKNA